MHGGEHDNMSSQSVTSTSPMTSGRSVEPGARYKLCQEGGNKYFYHRRVQSRRGAFKCGNGSSEGNHELYSKTPAVSVVVQYSILKTAKI